MQINFPLWGNGREDNGVWGNGREDNEAYLAIIIPKNLIFIPKTIPMKNLVVLSGAGVSAESGISTFRDAG
jgi:hypothetical protein